MKMIIAAAALLAACAPSASSPAEATKETAAPAGALTAPTPEGATYVVRADDDGVHLEVAVGETIAVELVGVPTAGYLWAPVELPAFLSLAGEYGGPTSRAQLEPGFTGGSHWEGFLFQATAAGEGVLRLEQRRPWDGEEPPADAFAVTVTVSEPMSE